MTNISPATIASAITSRPASATTLNGVASETATNPTNSSGTGNTALNSDFETFLKMLTVQAQNQDPLNPMDSTEYAAQLAAFSSVEQQVLTNDLLTGLDGRFGSMGLAQMAHWVGMEARVEAPAFFTGNPVDIFPSFENRADSSTLVVTDSNGSEIQRLPINPGADTVSWPGLDSEGAALPQGLYSFAVESFAGGELLRSHPAEVFTRIDEIQNRNGTVSLVLDGGTRIDTSDVTALREA